MLILLTDPKPYDLIPFFQMNQDEDFQREFANIKKLDLEKTGLWLDGIIKRRHGPELFDFAFIKLTEEENLEDHYDFSNSILIGFITLSKANEATAFNSGFSTLLSYGIIKEFSGKGLMTQALNIRMERYRERKIDFISAYVKDDNVASVRVLEKCGFIKVRDNLLLGRSYVRNLLLDDYDFTQRFGRGLD